MSDDIVADDDTADLTGDVTGLADDLYDVIGLLRRRSRRLVGAPLPELKLSGAQLELVRVVRRNPGITVAESARVLGLAANTVSTLVGQLLAVDVLVRERDSSDRRVARLDLTASARTALEQWRDRRAQTTATALAGLPADERARLGDALVTIARIAADLPESTDASQSPPAPASGTSATSHAVPSGAVAREHQPSGGDGS
ncbi:MarR family winged helix-turn-helix transcriptional regulator [Terrabacter sp. C0L_2]|uniref:MarR family winged helix-turn-helix transcriptional regulator n=1 Tax=Terrabacter sp. C0L_2 TaxID=3108389 RepID=UPI002ED164CA|nr:MarR family winged helix-turn-helix transcriptional regulator [Terrabacter sp. C0L_2]